MSGGSDVEPAQVRATEADTRRLDGGHLDHGVQAAVGKVVPYTARALALDIAAAGQPTGVGIWRNLRGWPVDNPYRSIGVEPMLGRVWDRAAGAATDLATTDADGLAQWRLSLCLEDAA